MNIFVTGDWVVDWNLARPANLPEGYFDGSSQTQLHHRPGGAWFVAHLIEKVACRDLTGPRARRVTCARKAADSIPGLNSEGKQSDDLAHAYTVWEKYLRQNEAKKDDKVWRVAEFAGCRKAGEWKSDPATAGETNNELVVVDDLGLGFSHYAGAVKHILSHAGNEAKVLVKHGGPPDGPGILGHLLKSDEFKKADERLHVVTSAKALRRRNAALSSGLSWDKVLEDLELEFRSGPSSWDLACCATAVVHFGVAGAAVFQQGRLDRFFFLSDELEQRWEDARPGSFFGIGSVLTACLGRHLIQPADYPRFFAITQAIVAQRVAHDMGAGCEGALDLDVAYCQRDKAVDAELNLAAVCIAPPQPNEKTDAKHLKGIQAFRTVWNPVDIKVWPRATAAGLQSSRILCNTTGTTAESLYGKAIEIVIQGFDQALAGIPKASYGDYLTIDRSEIESVNEIRRLILEYKANPDDKRPLSIAVFGAPGTGKSFSIKEICKAIFGKDKQPLEFNLTQIKTPQDLHRAFHLVRDQSIRHEIPLVFWDEFDTAGLQWLPDFLAPMQDHEFFDGSHKHPFGKCILIFAGGTCATYEEFKGWISPEFRNRKPEWKSTAAEPWHPSFKAVKGPDFVSRLRGFLNVKGPNPASPSANAAPEECISHDPAYVLRRAVLLRTEINRNFKQLIDPDSKRVRIASNVLHAFLTVSRYEHGARSITALLNMSGLTGSKAFTTSALSNEDLRRLHVLKDFEDRLKDPAVSDGLHDALAQAAFEAWKTQKTKQGYVYGDTRNDDESKPPLTHPEIKEWSKLTPQQVANNYDPVWRRLLEIQQAGYKLVMQKAGAKAQSPRSILILTKKLLAREHKIWLADHLTKGYTVGDKTLDHLRQHTDVKRYEHLPQKQKELNEAIVDATLKAIRDANFRIVRR